MRIAILFNEPTLAAGHPDYASEAGVLESVAAMEAALTGAGHFVERVGLSQSAGLLMTPLACIQADVILNLFEGFASQSSSEAHLAGLLELSGQPYTGSGPECLALVRDKRRTKLLLKGAGLPTAEFWYVAKGQAPMDNRALDAALQHGPLFVKPASEDASVGIGPESVATSFDALHRQVSSIQERYGDVLIEQYIPGREFNAGVIALPEPHVLPLAEIQFSPSAAMPWPIVTYAGKWTDTSDDYAGTPVRCPAEVEPELALRIGAIAREAFLVTGCRDYARVDFRVTPDGEIYVLEVNANPDAGPSAGLARALKVADIQYEEFARRLVATAAARGAKDKPAHSHGHRSSRNIPHPVVVRPYDSRDRERLLAILGNCEMFRPDEIAVAAEILDEAAQAGPSGHYKTLVAEADGRAIGWSCHGLVPMTDATYDLYWIAVDPKQQSRGIGRMLLETVQRTLSNANGRWLLAETSSTAAYEKTRAFYLRAGFSVVGNVPDFYRPSDGKVTFAKRV